MTCSFPPGFGTFLPLVIVFLETVLADTTLVPATNLTTFNFPGLLGSLKLLYCSLLAMTLIFILPLAFSWVIDRQEKVATDSKETGT